MPVDGKGDELEDNAENQDQQGFREVMTPSEAARYLRIASAKIYELLNSGKVVARNLGDRRRPNWRIHKGELDRYLSPEPVAEIRKISRPKPKQIIR